MLEISPARKGWLVMPKARNGASRPGLISERKKKSMSAAEMVKRAVRESPDVRLVLEIAARARETQGRELPREINPSTEVVAIPCNPQLPVSCGVLQ